MTTHNMRLKEKYFNLIKEGKKTIELRLYDDKRQKIQLGDEIVFTNGDNHVRTLVLGLFISKSFDQLFKKVNPAFCGFSTKEEAIEIMEQFYPATMQEETGVVGICIQVIKG